MAGIVAGSSLLILIVTALRRLLRGRVSARIIYALWALVLLRLLVPVSFELGLPSTETAMRTVYERAGGYTAEERTPEVPAMQSPDFGGAALPGVDAALTPSAPDTNLPAQVQIQAPQAEPVTPETSGAAEPFRLSELARPVWLAGSAAAFLIFLAQNLSFYARLRRTRRPAGRSEQGLYVYETVAVVSPCLFGLFRPAVYLRPEDSPRRRYVLAHEDCHFRHLDHIWALLRAVCLVIYWWDPLVWLAAVLSRTDCELACDEAALSRLGEPERRAYGETLISLASRPGPAELLRAGSPMGSGKRELKTRVLAITRGRKKLVIPAVLAVVFCVFCAACTFSGGETDADGTAEGRLTGGTAFSRVYETPTDWSECGGVRNDFEGGGVTLNWYGGGSASYTFSGEDERLSAGYFLSGSVNAIAFADAGGVTVLSGTGTEPENWAESRVEPDIEDVNGCIVGFTTERDGWLLVKNGHGFEVYTTSDGGAVWAPLCSGTGDGISGALFTTDGLGLLGFYSDTGEAPELWLTTDGGRSWSYPELPPVSDRVSIVLTPRLTENGIVLAVQHGPALSRDYYISVDNGASWRELRPVEQDDFTGLTYSFGGSCGSFTDSSLVGEALDVLDLSGWAPSEGSLEDGDRLSLTLTGPGAPAKLEIDARDLAWCTDSGEVFALPEGSYEALLGLLTSPGSGDLAAEPAEGVLNIFVAPTEAGGELRYYAPEAQTELAALFEAAMDGADTELSTEPGVQQLGLGVLDTEGYYWAFLTDGGMETTISAWNSIPAEAALPLREYVEAELYALGLSPAVEPREIRGLVSATLRGFYGGDFTVTDTDTLGKIEALLADSEPAYHGSCGFDMYLELELGDGRTLTLGMAEDGCPVWQSQGRYYMYPAESNSALYSWFAPELIAEMTAAELLDSPLIAYLDWTKYDRAMGTEKMVTLMRELGEAARESEEAAAKFLGAQLGLDGAYSEAYSDALYELYLAAPGHLARAWEELDEDGRSDTVLRLAFRMDRDETEVETELRQLAAEGRRLYSAEGFGEDALALLLTEEQSDGTLDFSLWFCEGWGETGDPNAEGSLGAYTVSGTAAADGSFTARLWGQDLSGRLSLSNSGAHLEYLSLSVSGHDFTDAARPYVYTNGPSEIVYNIYLPVDFREQSPDEFEALWRNMPYFSGEEEMPIPTRARLDEIFRELGLPTERWNSGFAWRLSYPQTVLSGRVSDKYQVEFYRSTDPEKIPRVRGITLGDTAEKVISRFPNRCGSFEALLAAAKADEDGSVTFYGCGPFFGDYGSLVLSEEGGSISFYSGFVGIIFHLNGELRVVGIERDEAA